MVDVQMAYLCPVSIPDSKAICNQWWWHQHYDVNVQLLPDLDADQQHSSND
jgi:hypothetical protein